jgi:predicted DNA-binding protein (MmcQ/YjbR family)
MPEDPLTIRERLRDFALELPGAHEDHPWGEVVVKVNKKVFVFLGMSEPPEHIGFTVKLADSHGQALSLPDTQPAGYGLGRAGWISVHLGNQPPPADVCADWVEESYRLVAPKRLIAELDSRAVR